MATIRFFLIFLVLLSASIPSVAAPVIGKTYPLKLSEVDGRTLSTSDGVVTVLVLASRAELDKAREVGNRIPDRSLGNPNARMVTVVRFANTGSAAMRYVFTSLVRRGLDSEAKRLKKRYLAKGLTRDPRPDLHGVADFNGQTAAQLGLDRDSAQFRVMILSGKGELLRDWKAVPSAAELSAALP
jgi:hypothetical protein